VSAHRAETLRTFSCICGCCLACWTVEVSGLICVCFCWSGIPLSRATMNSFVPMYFTGCVHFSL